MTFKSIKSSATFNISHSPLSTLSGTCLSQNRSQDGTLAKVVCGERVDGEVLTPLGLS